MKVTGENNRKAEKIERPSLQPALRAAWRTPRLGKMDVDMSLATPGGNAEGDGTS